MPDQESHVAYRPQLMLLWPKTGNDRYGQPNVGPVQQLNVRWDDTRHEALDPHGETIMADASIVTDIDLLIDSLVWKGGLTDIPGTSVVPPGDLLQVIAFSKIPDIKGRAFFRRASLMRWRGALPQAQMLSGSGLSLESGLGVIMLESGGRLLLEP